MRSSMLKVTLVLVIITVLIGSTHGLLCHCDCCINDKNGQCIPSATPSINVDTCSDCSIQLCQSIDIYSCNYTNGRVARSCMDIFISNHSSLFAPQYTYATIVMLIIIAFQMLFA